MIIDLPHGSIGQIQGPFTNTDTIDFSNKDIKIGISIGEKDLMTYGGTESKGFTVKIDDVLIRFGRDGIYELDEEMRIGLVSFPQGAPASVLIEYVIL